MRSFVCLFVSLVAFLGAHQFSQDQLDLFASLRLSEAYLNAFPFETYKKCLQKNGDLFYVDFEKDMIKRFLAQGIGWENNLKEYMRKYVRSGSIALDIGAHIGIHTVTMAQSVGSTGFVVAFEPQSKLYREHHHNLKLNKITNVITLHCALSNARGKTRIAHNDNDEGGCAIGSKGEEVEMRTLDSFGFTDVSFMKIDVEGHEDFVIRGARKTILNSHPVILIEFLPHTFSHRSKPLKKQFKRHKTIRQLVALGYEVKKVDHIDYLAIPRKRR